MAISLSVNDATEILRYALRDSIKRNSIWHLIQGVILIFAGVLSILYPLVSATSAVAVLGWLLIASGITQAISLIGARRAPISGSNSSRAGWRRW